MNRRTWDMELLKETGRQFNLRGQYIDGAPYGSGHINDTFAVVYDQAGTRVRYIHQRLNSNVFKDPAGLMKNVALVCRYTGKKTAGDSPPGDASRRTLTLVPAGDGRPYWIDDAEDYWRTYFFIERASTHDTIRSPGQAREAARAFGRFQAFLSDLPAERLTETIPNMHHTGRRFDALKNAIEADPKKRASGAADEIEFASSREPLAFSLLEPAGKGLIPVRVTHNDTKLNNVMLDDETGEGICVIDLDTVMPGLSLYDFGDMVRTAVSPTAEDEQDLSAIQIRTEMFEALAGGFLETAGSFLNETEKANLVTAGKLLTYENGIRFLTDYLSGDVYFKIHRPGHNLDRCRTQFQLLRELERRGPELEAIVEKILS